ncbi:hypothetical protein [Nocardiopsis valliformis]|uniref:hypothetical protein n=1 Tax=Nocardiopsis valliformis TaxID=239974 RepID=UPI00126906FE|nr:hypothetical protein [Nocardiopsis valliformis]
MTKTAALAGAATLLAITGCAQDNREYIQFPADSGLAWSLPEEAQDWVTDPEEWERWADFTNDSCRITFHYKEDVATSPRYITPESSSRDQTALAGSQLGDSVAGADINTIDPIEIAVDGEEEETVEFHTTEVVGEKSDVGVRAGSYWHGDDELQFLYRCSFSDSWSEGEEDMYTLLEDMRVILP